MEQVHIDHVPTLDDILTLTRTQYYLVDGLLYVRADEIVTLPEIEPSKPMAEFIYRREYTDMGNLARAAYFLVPFTAMLVMAFAPFIVWGDLRKACIWIASHGFTALNGLIEQHLGVRVTSREIVDATAAACLLFILCGLTGLLAIRFLMDEWSHDERLLKIGRALDVPRFWMLAGWFSAPFVVSPVATFFMCKVWAGVTDA
jgi:hypothetical protein